MAHFAELDQYNRVIRVLVACNQDIANNGGEQSEQAAKFFETVCPLTPIGVKYVQTSYNNNFRRIFAGNGSFYDPELNIFYSEKPFESWSLDENKNWVPPIEKPNDSNYSIIWNENNLRWHGINLNDNYKYYWNHINSTWIKID
jgi:hypothetical protein